MAELIAASREGDEVEAERLLDHRADVNASDEWLETPLHNAENEAIVKLLLDRGADVHARDQWQTTPLHRAKNEAMAKLLLDHGADVHARNQWQITPLHHAWNEAIAKLLLDHGADVHARDEEQSTPLHGAKDAAKAKLLLDHGADVHARNQFQQTPLHLADNEAIAKLLLDREADVHARDQWQYTPLHLARNVAIAKLLVNRGAQLTAVNENGLNALHIAAKYANLDFCLFFVSRGLDPNLADKEGETALTRYGRDHDDNDPDEGDPPPLTVEEKQEAIDQIMAVREAYEQRVRDEHWKKNWPLMNTLTSSGLRPMAVEVAALALEQASLDTSVSLPGIPRDTPAKNIAYLNRAVFGHEGFLCEIASFIPRVRFEVGEGEEEEEEEEEEQGEEELL